MLAHLFDGHGYCVHFQECGHSVQNLRVAVTVDPTERVFFRILFTRINFRKTVVLINAVAGQRTLRVLNS
jgi:hypothetical protein